LETKGPLPLSLATGREGSEGKGGDATVAIVWACRIPVEEYVGGRPERCGAPPRLCDLSEGDDVLVGL